MIVIDYISSKKRPCMRFIRLQKKEDQKTSDIDKWTNVPRHMRWSHATAVLNRAPNFPISSKGLEREGGIRLVVVG